MSIPMEFWLLEVPHNPGTYIVNTTSPPGKYEHQHIHVIEYDAYKKLFYSPKQEERGYFKKSAEKFRDSAFPTSVDFDYQSDPGKKFVSNSKGLSKREYFAAKILQGLCVPCIPGSHNCNDEHESLHKVKMAVGLADALLKELSVSEIAVDEQNKETL